MKILIVDDDPNIIEQIKNMIHWDDMGITQVLSSYNGAHAKKVIQTEKPEIVICDIEMPQCNGIEVLRYIYENNIETEFIFLTCYDDFSYAKKAIEYNAMGYLTKPFKPEEVCAVVMKAVAKINNKKTQNELIQKEDLWRKNQDIINNSFLWAIFQKTVPNNREKLKSIINYRKLNFDVNEQYYIVYSGINIHKLNLKDYKEADFFYIFHHLVLEVVDNQYDFKNAVEFTLAPYDILLLVVRASEATKETLFEKCEKLIAVSKTYLDTDVVCMVSNLIHCEEFADIKKEMDNLFLQEAPYGSKVLIYSDINNSKEAEACSINFDKVIKYIKNKEKISLIKYIRDFMEESMKGSTLNAHKMNIIHHDLLQIFYGYLQENCIQADRLLQDKITRQMNDSAEYSVPDMMKYVNYMFDRTKQLISEIQNTSTIVTKAKEYIQQHFTEDIDRNDVANSVFLTPNYLSKLFNSESGMTIRDYINQLRIDEAKKMLNTTNKTICMIAMDVGFENVSYFSTVFKKYCGSNPETWRKFK